jgi:hypothetical protein
LLLQNIPFPGNPRERKGKGGKKTKEMGMEDMEREERRGKKERGQGRKGESKKVKEKGMEK